MPSLPGGSSYPIAERNSMAALSYLSPTSGVLLCTEDLSDEERSNFSYTPDSISQKRRHGEYFHRPPVWFPRSLPDESSSVVSNSDGSDLDERSTTVYRHSPSFHEEEVSSWRKKKEYPGRFDFSLGGPWSMHTSDLSLKDGDTAISTITSSSDQGLGTIGTKSVSWSVDTDTFHDSNSQHVRATSDVRGRNFNQSSTEDETSNSNHQAVLRQPAAKLCNRLVSYRDIRCKDTDSWAIEEGSVVIGIDPSLVRIRQDNRDADELRLRLGNFYVIGRMFSDMWAWCFEIAVDLPGNYQMRANEGIQVGFVPLCAVTLAANFSSFLQRCQRNRNRSYSGSLYPGNGLVVEPPQRDWSTVASRELSRVERLNLPSAVQFPKAVKMIYETFTSLDNPGTEYVPWDSSVQILLSQLSNDANRQSRTKRRNSWLGPKTLLTPFFGSPKQFPSHNQEPSTASSLTHHLGTSDSELNPPSDKEVASVSQKTPQRENSSRSLSYSLKRLISKSSGKTHRE